MIPRAYVENFTKAINTVSERSRLELQAALEAIDYDRDVATVRAEVVDVMQAYCGGASDLTAQLAAEFYDGLREYELGARMGAYAASGREAAATEGAVRAFAEKLVDGNVEAFIDLCLSRLDYEAKVAAARCVIANGRRDPAKPRFARVPTGAETCDFCLMLASRGFVYASESTASHTHSGCDCRVVPSWKALEVDGYDPSALYDQWQDYIDRTARERSARKGTTYDEERRAIMQRYEDAAKNARKR